ncbi:MAG: electron transport complex subunit RsxC [Bacteroidales bacterium]|nr:electron transport complex subunit RsxC [Bacteroidales bacterium]
MLKTFILGGVHPEEHKLSAGVAIRELPVPEQVVVPFGQNLGAPSKPVVKRGEKVKAGQLIAEASSFISANVHAPVSGTISKIDNVMDVSGYKRPCAVITVEGNEWEEEIDLSETLVTKEDYTAQEIIEKVKKAGIVGMGGATFPTHIKLMVPKGKKAEYLIINGVECEPYLTSDHRLMLEKGEEILVGIRLLMIALGVEKAMIGIENNKPDAIEYLTTLSKKYKGITVHALKVKYPQGGEKQLIKALTNREVPSGKLPVEVGCVVQNVGTAFAVYEAVQKNKPLIDRVVTVTGKAVKTPSNFKVRIGTPVRNLIEAAGGLPENTGMIINGGPMMGKALINPDVPIVKGSSGILILEDEFASRPIENPCIRCSKCTNVCPMGLEPYLLSRLARTKHYAEAEKENIMDCIECGSCQYTCPADIPLLDYLRLGKSKVGEIIRKRN